MRAVSVLQGPQTLISVLVTDALTGLPLDAAALRIETKPRNGAWTPLPFDARSQGAGRFAVSASLSALQARLRLAVPTVFRVTARCRGYDEASSEIRLTRTKMRLAEEALVVAGQPVTRCRLRGAPMSFQVALSPPAVRLAGVVIEDGDLSAGVAGADVSLDGDAATAVQTDGNGRFVFESVPVQRTVVVAAQKGADAASRTHLIDYDRTTNRVTLSFVTQPNN